MSFWSDASSLLREFGSRATLFSNGAVFRSFLNIESYAIAAKSSRGSGMVGQVVSGRMASLARPEFAISWFAKGFLATAAITVASVAMMTSPAMMSQASAQSFTQALVFGDSTVDTGFYKVLGSPGGGNKFNIAFAAAIAAGGTGAPTNSPGLMNSQILAGYFGLRADPANQPGGTNFATSGAKNVLVNTGNVPGGNGGFLAAIPTMQQIDNYLASVGGHANGNGLYLVSSGGNDISFAFSAGGPADKTLYLQNAADGLTNAIAKLQAAGARTIIVPGLNYSFPIANPAEQAAELAYTKALWSGLAERGVNFIPGDFNAVRVAIAANPSAFGFRFIGSSAAQAACTQPTVGGVLITAAYSLLCISNPNPADPVAQSHLKTADAAQTHLFADNEHLTTAGQKIQADYYYSLLIAPSQISFLAENAVQARTGTVAGIQDQIGISRLRQTAGFNVWINGDVSSLKINNPAPGFPGDPSTPLSGTVGLDYKSTNGYLLGAAITTGTQTPGFDLGGKFKQQEIAGSVYGGYLRGPSWASVIATYGALDYDVNRIVPIGITLQNNNGKTDGSNISVALQGGYDFAHGALSHGPVAGLTWQHVDIGGFTETGSFTSLRFDNQNRDSLISGVGYKATYDFGRFRPYVQAVWNHEFASDRMVRASLTTIEAPSYEMPAVKLGRDWAAATVGTTMNISNAFTGLASFTAQAGQAGVTTYGGRVGLNYRIN
jgi:outer membrane lipase/esterase